MKSLCVAHTALYVAVMNCGCASCRAERSVAERSETEGSAEAQISQIFGFLIY